MNMKLKVLTLLFSVSLSVAGLTRGAIGQEAPPAPQAPKSVSIPGVKEVKLPNGLTVALIERKNVPLVTVQLLVRSGASSEDPSKAGLANFTASLLTKGTKTRSATQIAEEIEFLGGSINTGAGWNNSIVNVTVTSDKLDQAMGVLADVVLNPTFAQSELDLLRSQALDGLTYNLKQPGFLASYVASKYSYGEHPAGGTPTSLASISRDDVVKFHSANYSPADSVLIFAGDITAAQAKALSTKFFGGWKANGGAKSARPVSAGGAGDAKSALRRILVVDLPNSGQASVNYLSRSPGVGRSSTAYYPASVLNSVLGGGYSSRLNQEIRIKRGLSYGAGSSFAWRENLTNFGARTQTKNESAAEVAELVMAELKRLGQTPIAEAELVPRKSVLTGNFGRSLETTAGLAAAVSELYSFNIPESELNSYMTKVQGVTDAQIRDFASKHFVSGDLIIVGDSRVFMEDLKKRFPGVSVEVIKAEELDLDKDNLRRSS
jgi:zinc protease